MSTFTNPAAYDDGVTRANPDPFVLRFRGRYYCYATGSDGVRVSVSPDLVTWKSLGLALTVEGRAEYWAPCVIYAQGAFWMYYSDRPQGSDDPHQEVLQVATSPLPQGPFRPRRRFFDTFSIDPHVVRDPQSGEYVMFYSTNDATGLAAENVGTSILIDRMTAMDRLAGQPRPVVLPTLDQEIFERNRFGDGRDWYTIEGATYFTHHDTAFLTYSGNAYVGTDYFIGYSRAAVRAADGSMTPVTDLHWSKFPSDYVYAPLVRRNDDVEGTGHNSVVKAPNLIDDWIVYHGRDADQVLDPRKEQRVMRVDRLYPDGDRLITDAPTASPQRVPAGPTIFEDFAAADLDTAWQVVSGRFSPLARTDAQAPAVRCEAGLGALLVHEREVSCFIAEVYVRAEPSDAGARYGVAPVFRSEADQVRVLIDSARREIEVAQVRRGIEERIAAAPLPVLDPTAWQHLRVERTFEVIDVWLDDLRLLTARTDDHAPSRIGLACAGTAAEFSAFTLTEHLDLWGERLRHLPKVFRSSRSVAVERGLRVGGRRPLRLTSDALPPASRIVHEVEILAPYGYAEVTLGDLAGKESVRARVVSGRYEIVHSAAGSQRRLAHGPLDAPRASVRMCALGSTFAIRIGGDAVDLPAPAWPDLRAQTELSGAVLHSFELTTASGTPPAGHHHKNASTTP
ncbi:glycoside hydrolase family 43 protein [Xylanimonas ulmi]|uniref:Glycosyl hydrolase family 43 n=1 Tax=Xylanimonas ulmi TaxID=228973 RepID=A0A4Q7M3P8_9MICO|nr:glycoside hydrolase family 43 protein [Xylanibacterium ulmi]RZS61961.1 glycosyl hydrolase family 43 [Xylanibacterium ulmi]